jgi:hypothetical protein
MGNKHGVSRTPSADKKLKKNPELEEEEAFCDSDRNHKMILPQVEKPYTIPFDYPITKMKGCGHHFCSLDSRDTCCGVRKSNIYP